MVYFTFIWVEYCYILSYDVLSMMPPLIFITSVNTTINYQIAFLCKYHKYTGFLEESQVVCE